MKPLVGDLVALDTGDPGQGAFVDREELPDVDLDFSELFHVPVGALGLVVEVNDRSVRVSWVEPALVGWIDGRYLSVQSRA